MNNLAPKYSKVELFFKENNSTTKLEFFDCGMILTGNTLIVVEDSSNEENALVSTGKIYQLIELIAYRTYKS